MVFLNSRLNSYLNSNKNNLTSKAYFTLVHATNSNVKKHYFFSSHLKL